MMIFHYPLLFNSYDTYKISLFTISFTTYTAIKNKRGGKKCANHTLGTRRKHKHTHGEHCPSVTQLTQTVSPAGHAVPPVAASTQLPPSSGHKHAAGAYSSDTSSVQPP